MVAPAVHEIVVVGCGRMGQGIARSLLAAGKTVTLVDAERHVAEAARDDLADRLQAQGGDWMDAVERLRVAGTVAGAARGKDLLIEAVYEDLDIKRQVFTDAARDPRIIMATNTSSFRVAEVAADPGRTIGMHYFLPAHTNRLVELVPAAAPPPVVTQAKGLLEQCGKRVVQTGDSRGFAVNRFLLAWAAEALRLTTSHQPGHIEQAARDAFGTPFGPLALLDLSGRDVCRHALQSLEEAHGDLYAVPENAIDEVPKNATLQTGGDPVIGHRLMGALLAAAEAVVADGVASRDTCDTSARAGLGWKQGPFELAAARPELAEAGRAHFR